MYFFFFFFFLQRASDFFPSQPYRISMEYQYGYCGLDKPVFRNIGEEKKGIEPVKIKKLHSFLYRFFSFFLSTGLPSPLSVRNSFSLSLSESSYKINFKILKVHDGRYRYIFKIGRFGKLRCDFGADKARRRGKNNSRRACYVRWKRKKKGEGEREREREKSLCFRVSHSKWNEFSTSRNCAHMETRAISFLLIAVDVSLPLRCACFLSSFLPFLSLSLSLSLFSFLFFSFLSVNFAY